MTRDRIIELLDLVILELASSNTPVPRGIAKTVQQATHGEPAIAEAEWAYVKGLASAQVLQLRDRLASVRPSLQP